VNTRDVTFDVSGLDGTVDSVSVEFSADHTWVGDLRVTLISPIGVPHLLFSRTGATTATSAGSGANLVPANTYRFSDSATVNWWDHVTPLPGDIPTVTARTTIEGGEGVSNPATATSLDDAFAATPPNGTWILRFEDGFSGDDGEVVSASLELTVQGVTRTVTASIDSGPGSLRDAITSAQPGDRIEFIPGIFESPTTIELQSALPTINQPIAIVGPGAELLTIRRADSAPDFRIFEFGGGDEQASASGLGISNGSTDDFGGGVLSFRPIVLSGVHIFGNFAATGGGLVAADQQVVLIDSTISGNLALGDAGGVFIVEGGPNSRLIGVTLSGNRAGTAGGGLLATNIDGDNDRLAIINSTIHQNQSPSTGAIRAESKGEGGIEIVLRNTIVSRNSPENFFLNPAAGQASISSDGFNLSTDYDGVVATLSTDLLIQP